MKIISSKEMSRIESEAFHAGASDLQFMESAADGIFKIISKVIDKGGLPKNILLLCGKGNNAGDAYLTGTLLLQENYKVIALQLAEINTASSLCQLQHKNFLEQGGEVISVSSEKDLLFPSSHSIIDGLFGTGFHGKIEDIYASAITMANQSSLPIFSIDIPSGIDGNTGNIVSISIQAQHTICLELPKTGIFLRDAWNHVGRLHYVDFGLDAQSIQNAQEDFILLEEDKARNLFPPISTNRHKYEAGYVVGLAGSSGMAGAAILSSLAALRSGAGIMRLIHPDAMQAELAGAPYEIIKQSYQEKEEDLILATLNTASAIFIGPGLERSEKTESLLKTIIPNIEKPCVLDAEALHCFAKNKTPLARNCIMTPHIGEMHKLLHLKKKSILDENFIASCAHFAYENNVTLILKGSPSFLFHKGKSTVINPYGTPAMATAGTGDVLTGIIAALLAQGLSLYNAAYLALYLHSRAGEESALEKGPYSLLASDLIEKLSSVFLKGIKNSN